MNYTAAVPNRCGGQKLANTPILPTEIMRTSHTTSIIWSELNSLCLRTEHAKGAVPPTLQWIHMWHPDAKISQVVTLNLTSNWSTITTGAGLGSKVHQAVGRISKACGIPQSACCIRSRLSRSQCNSKKFCTFHSWSEGS